VEVTITSPVNSVGESDTTTVTATSSYHSEAQDHTTDTTSVIEVIYLPLVVAND
jgi:hypothetical protein